METYALDPVQEMAARAIILIERNAPKCPECGSTVLRPKCALELDPNSCPRHEIAGRVHEMIRQVEIMGRLRNLAMWRQRTSILQLVGPPSADDLKTLEWLIREGGTFKSPRRTATFDSPPLAYSGYWSASNDWKFTLTERGRQYYEETKGSQQVVASDQKL